MPNTPKKTCTSGKFGRLNYYHGMLLTEEDCQYEQTYFREKMKLHNRLHGYGVVWGLELKERCIEIDGNKVFRIFIEPGFALDCAGNEIVVCYPHMVPLDDKLEELRQSCKPLHECTRFIIAIKYCECESDPRPQYTSQCADDELNRRMSRVCEGYCVKVLDENDVKNCCKDVYTEACRYFPSHNCPGLAGCCEEDHVIILGCFVLCPSATTSQESAYITNKAQTYKAVHFKEEDLDPCCKPRRICTPCRSPESRWDHYKHLLIQEACKANEWVDFSGVVGKPVSEAVHFIEDLGLHSELKSINDYDPNDLMRIVANAVSCAEKNSRITLIQDQEKKCVLFAMWEPSPE